jgi:hypothetical protein
MWSGAVLALRSWLRRVVLPSMATSPAFSGQLSRSGKGGSVERGGDPVHQDGEPVLAGDAMLAWQMLAEKFEMRRTPGGDVIVVVAVGDGAADDEQQHLRQRMLYTPHIARVLHLRDEVRQCRDARPAGRVS